METNQKSSMPIKSNLALLFLGFFLAACQSGAEPETNQDPTTESTLITEEAASETLATPAKHGTHGSLAKTLEAHGGDLYETAHYGFVFRGKQYTFHNQGARYTYSRSEEKDGQVIVDSLTNDGVSRRIDGAPVELTEKERKSISEGVNSVIYFATLPHKLKDPAVIAVPQAPIEIKGKTYEVLKVNFQETGGGTDFEDNYRYWINTETGRMDYLAYDYKVNGGGVRFRSAYNPRVVNGILFQDYVNYRAPVGTALDDLPLLYESGKLEELSRIKLDEIQYLELGM